MTAMLSLDLVEQATLYSALANEVRLSLLLALYLHGDTMDVQHLQGYLCKKHCEVKQSTVSHHLSILLQAKMVECRQDGHYHYYRISEGKEDLIHQALFGRAP